MVNFLGIMQNEWAGAQAFSSFDTYLAPFVKADHLTYREVKKCIESFIFGVNIPSRWGTQAPFSNITLDWTVPNDLANLPAIVGGKEQDFTYGDCKEEMDMINRAFIETMIEGDAQGRGFQYPIPTYSITKDFDWSDTENNRLLFEMTAKYGTPYFSNYINSDMEPSDVRSMCCRLRLDLRELRKKSGGFFGSGESTGSVGVVTINMPRIAYLSKNEEEFYERLDKMMDIAARSLHIKRVVISRLLDEGLYPYTKRYLGSFDNHFSTIGLIGMNEAGLNAKWIRKDLTHPETQKFTKDVLNHMRERLSDYQEEYGDLYNLEATSGRTLPHTRLAKHDDGAVPGYALQQQRTVEHHITQTALICRLAIRRMYLPHWIFRMSCRRCIHQERYSIHSWEKNFRTGSQRQLWSEKSQRIISCRIIQCLQHILSVRIMDTFPESSILVRSVEKKQRYTAELPVIIVRSRTGMMENCRNLRNEKCMM